MTATLTPDQLRRRAHLEDLLDFAERCCPIYAAKAAKQREELGRRHGCPSMFAGMGARFDVEWGVRKAKQHG